MGARSVAEARRGESAIGGGMHIPVAEKRVGGLEIGVVCACLKRGDAGFTGRVLVEEGEGVGVCLLACLLEIGI